MALFNKGKSDKPMAQQDQVTNQINLVGEGTVFEGTLNADSDVRASGRVVGTLDVDGKAIVAKGGAVEGELIATNADVAGHVQGEIRVEELLVLKSSARVDGNITTDRLVVEEGAVFTGECAMGEAAEEKKKAAAANGTSSVQAGSDADYAPSANSTPSGKGASAKSDAGTKAADDKKATGDKKASARGGSDS
jgi:cytoskeletal protein CcmA (bactofilin family)